MPDRTRISPMTLRKPLVSLPRFARSYNKRISGYGLSPFAKIGSLRSPTSDMRQTLGEITKAQLELNLKGAG